MKFIQKAWDFFSGKKTVIGMLLLLIAQLLVFIDDSFIPSDPAWIAFLVTWLNKIGAGLGAIGVAHKAVK